MKTAETFRAAVGLFSLATVVLFTGCKKDDDDDNMGIPVNNDLFGTVALVTTGGSFTYPSSAVPDASGQFIYFTGVDAAGAGVFKVPAAGGTAVAVYTGAPFSKPMDLVLSTDNQTIFVADSAAGILSLSISGGAPMLVPGTAGTSPVALDVILRSGQDQIYFCGTNSSDSQPAVFEIASGGSASATVRHKGAPLTSPAGIVSAKNGMLFIADKSGVVHQLSATGIGQVVSGIIMGSPSGIALTPDDRTVAVSSKNSSNGTAQVHLIDLATTNSSIFNKVIGENSNPGGLHVARNASGATGTYAWADVTRSGRVYRLDP